MISFDDVDVDTLSFIGEQESQYLVGLAYFTDDIERLLSGSQDYVGATLPWKKTHDFVRFRPGETTIWAGINGHGKSMISGMTALWMMEKQAVCIASLEMPVRQTIRRMLRQQNGVKAPTVEMFRRLKDWCPENFVIYDQTDTVAADRILGMMHYAARELAVKQIFLDSLVKCGLPTDDYNAQARLMDKLCWVAKTEDIHIHVVMHMRKGRDEKERPGKFDIKGAGELTDLADNVLVCWRNKRKEAEYEKHQACQPNDYSDEDPDTVLTVHKQRHGEWENSINLWFDDVSQAYLSSPSADIPAFPWGV